MTTEQSNSEHFYIDARGGQEASGARVILRDGRARIVVYEAHAIELTRIQTEELGRWLTENAPVQLTRSCS